MQILVVEDEIMLAESLKEILEKNKHTVYLAYDGEEGMEIARSLALDMIILDVMLPEIKRISGGKRFEKRQEGDVDSHADRQVGSLRPGGGAGIRCGLLSHEAL